MRRRRTLLAVVAVGVALTLDLAAVTGAPRGCDPARPETCTLRELADRLGIRMGAAAGPDQLSALGPAGLLAREFNSVTPENAMKMYTTQAARGGWDWADADATVAFAEEHGMEVRGHTLVWAQDAYTPRWVLEITDPAELRAVLEEHITATIDRYEGRVRRWDVVNEPLDGTNVEGAMGDNVYARVLGPGWIAEVFAMARAADPGAELWINEWGTDYFPGRHEAFVSLVRDLREAGVPVDGVGLQTHRFFGGPTGPGVDAFARMLRDYADLGVDVAVTELDIPIDPADPDGLTRQAGAYQRIVSACLLVSRCQEVTTWGITDASTWLDTFVVPVLGPLPAPTRPLLFDEAGQPKPAYLAVRDTLAAATRPAPPPSSTAPTVSSPSTTVPVAAPIPAAPVTAAPRYTG